MKQILCSCMLLGILFAIFHYSKAATVNLKQGDTCASVCSGKENIFKFEEEKIYTYNFLSKHSIKNPNSEQESVQLELKGKAEISKIAACDFSLQLSEVVLTESITGKESDTKNYEMMKKSLQKYSLRFGFDDGRIVGVCSQNKDNEFVVNVKKAILSSLQVSLDSLEAPNYLTETDVSGDCITEYTTAPEPPNFVVVKKTKSISGCARKNKFFSVISGKVSEEPMENRNFALLDGAYSCEIKIKRSEGLKESICKETQTFKPFTSDKSGSSVVINQELRFDSVKSGKISTPAPTTRTDLIMNHGNLSPHFMKKKEKPASDVAKQLCVAIENNAAGIERTQLFVQFVRSLSKASYNDIQAIYRYFSENAVCSANKSKLRKILLDALPHSKTSDAIKFLFDDSKIYNFHKLGFSVTENVSPELIEIFSNKLDDDTIGNSASLTLTTMIKGYCDKNPGCMLNPIVLKAMTGLLKKLGTDCNSKDQSSNDRILFTLRAIANVGDYPDYKSLVSVLESCVNSPLNDDNIKIFSIEVVGQFPCNANIDTFLWSIYDGISFSSEIRIQAYLSLIRCPLRETFRKVIQKLNSENSQQLGSFVWSHISNLMETSDSFKSEQREMLQIFTKPMGDLSKKFNLDFRSYSKNVEKTYQRGYSAAKIDSNIIFTASPLPSSISANVTIDSFGRSMNILQFGIRRTQGEGVWSMFLKPAKNEHPDIIKIDKKNEKKQTKSSFLMYYKVMGREVYFNPNIMKDLFAVVTDITKKKSFEKSILFMDTTVSISSITGFPIELAVEAAVSAEFSMSTSETINLNDFSVSTKNNIAFQIIGKLQVNSHCTKIGVQSTGVASSDSEFGGKFKFISGKQNLDISVLSDYQFEINKMPDDRKLISISNELKLIHNLKKVESKPQYEVLLDKCTGNSMLELRGIKICASVSSAARYGSFFPNLKAELIVKKFNGFRFQLRKENTLKPMNKLTSFLISNSFQGNDKDTFKFQFNRNVKEKKQMYELSLWNKDIYFKFDVDGKKISGQMKYGDNEAGMSGVIESKSILKSVVNLNIKTKTDEIILYFENAFSKEGSQISLTARKSKDKEFSLQSNTTMKITDHKIFNYFRRFRHSTDLKVAGGNKFSLLFESSKSNNPTMEMKAKLKSYWKTKGKYNFNVKQNYMWSKYSVVDRNFLFEKIPGINYTISLDQEFEVKDKKYNLKHSFNYFISNGFSIFGDKPSLVALKMDTFDLIGRKFKSQINFKLFLDLMSVGKGKVMLQNFINHPGLKFYQDLKAAANWKRNTLEMYDIKADISESDLLKILFKHKFTTTQNGESSLEIKYKDLLFKINSELMLPKKHILSIYWSQKSLKIESKVETKSLNPFNTVINHDITLDKKLIATIVNTVEYNVQKKRFSFNSIGKDSSLIVYSVGFGGQLTYTIGSNQLFYDFASNIEFKLPQRDIHITMENLQFADIKQKISPSSEKRLFQSKFVYKNNKNSLTYGYDSVLDLRTDREAPYKLENTIYKGSSSDKLILRYGEIKLKFIFGLSMDCSNRLKFEILKKVTLENNKVTTSLMTSFDSKTNEKYNFYYKNNIVCKFKAQESYSLSWSGKHGKSKDSPLTPSQGSFTIFFSKYKKLVLNFDLIHPLLSRIKLSKIMFGLNMETQSPERMKSVMVADIIVKWQKEGARTTNYYELKINVNSDKSKPSEIGMEFEALVMKDSSLTKLIEIKGKLKKAEKLIESIMRVKYDTKNAEIQLNVNAKDLKNHDFLFSIKSSAALLKEFTLSSDLKSGRNTIHGTCKLTFESTNLYKIEIVQIRKYDFNNGFDIVSNVKWNSNVPYLESGSYGLGILVYKMETFKVNFNVNHKNSKKINIKFSADTTSKEIQLLAESSIGNAVKFSLHGTMPSDDSVTFKLEFGYKESFLKIHNTKLRWKNDDKVRSSSFTMTLLSSNEDLTDIVMTSDRGFEVGKFFTTYKLNHEIKYKGKSIHSVIFDLPAGKIKIESTIMKIWIINNLKFNLKYQFNSIRDMRMEFSLLAEPKFKKSEFEFIYFRAAKGENTKNIEKIGEVLFYSKLKYQYLENHLRKVMYINKDLNKGNMVFKANLPKINLDQSEVSMDLDLEKESDKIYKGKASFGSVQYKFKYESHGNLKRSLEINGVSADAKMKQILISYDFQNDIILQVKADQIFNAEVNVKSQSPGIKSGTVKLTFKEKELLNLNVNTDVKKPNDIETFTDYFRAIIGIKTGMHLKFKVSGKFLEKIVTRELEVYHLESTQFAGGIRSFYKTDVSVTDTNKMENKVLYILDRKFPTFYAEYVTFMKVDGEVKVDINKVVNFKSKKDFFISDFSKFTSHLDTEFLVIYNDQTIQTKFLLDIPPKNLKYGFGFRKQYPTSEVDLHLVCNTKNYTMETNLGSIRSNVAEADYFPIGKEYYVKLMKNYEIRISRRKAMAFDAALNYNWEEPIKVTLELVRGTKVVLNIKGTTTFENIKNFHWKLEKRRLGKQDPKNLDFEFSSLLKVNKKTLSELLLTYVGVTPKAPHQIKLDYKGHRIIKGVFMISTDKYQFSHSIKAKDGTFKTELWTSKSKCHLKPSIDCYINHKNNVREIVVGVDLTDDRKRMELTWDKNKGRSLIITKTKKGSRKTILFENPIKRIKISSFKETVNDVRVGVWGLDVTSVDKTTNKDIMVVLKYKMKGSLSSDYMLDLGLKTNLFHKEIRMSVKRDVSVDIGDLYAIDIKAFFDKDEVPFLGVKGYLRQLSSRSYEMKLHTTNFDKFAILTTTVILAPEEITFEYKLIQSNKSPREFLIQYIPFRKLHLTNKKDFKILLSRVIYQYGHRGDYVIKLGAGGTNVVAYSTYTRNPLRYYAELNNDDQKTVIHIRPIGKSIIGEVYRKSSGQKVLDSSLKISVDDNDILTSKLYWDPKIFTRMKELCGTIFAPKNIKTLMAKAYESSENQLSSFMSNVKLDVIKNMNVAVSLEFVKGVANDWEMFPKNLAKSYDNDDYFMKTLMTKLTNCLEKLDLPSQFNKVQTYLSEFKNAVSKTTYEWLIDAKLYTVLHTPATSALNTLTYTHVKNGITKFVGIGTFTYKVVKKVVNNIGDALDKISEIAKANLKITDDVKDRIAHFYKNSFLVDILNLFGEIKDEILDIIAKIMNTDVVKQRIKYYQDAMKNSQEIVSLIKDFKGKLLQYFKSSSAVTTIRETINLIRSLKYKDAFLNLIKIEETKFQMNLDEASIELRFYVPPLSRRYIKATKALVNWLPTEAIYQVHKSSLGEKLLELFYRYEYLKFNYGDLNLGTLKKLFPPFTKTAWVVNGNSILSFDGSSLKIGPGKCSYLLARDFNKKSFSLIMNINPETNEKEFELFYIKKITILQSGLVKVDGEIVDILPKVFKDRSQNFLIYRDNDIVKIKTSEGLIVKYFHKMDSLKVKLNGNWHGYVKGLLGSNDFDYVNDWSTPNGLITHDAGIFSKSWSLGICDGKTKTGFYAIRVDQNQLQKCVKLFHPDSGSYLKRCHSLINPEPYFELCHRSLQYSPKTNEEFMDILCSLSRNYVMRCKANGIMIRLEKSCVKCNGKDLNTKLSVNDLSKTNKINYIFIMEQSSCLKPYMKLIRNLVDIMGVGSKNKFTLLSHSSKGMFQEVHFKSVGNKTTSDKEGFVKLLEDFWSSDQLADISIQKTSQPGKAIYDAIKMSSEPGYAERIILIGCSACSENEKYVYSLLAGLLNEARISVTYVTTQKLSGSGADLNTLGFGNKLVYFFDKDSNTIKTQPWKRNVQAPKDSCSPLARLKDGFVWSLQSLDSDTKMRRLTESIYTNIEKIKDLTIQKCSCAAGNYDEGSVQCRISKSRSSYLLF